MTTAIRPILLTRKETAQALSLSERTVQAIPEELLPRCRTGIRGIRHRYVDVEDLAARLAQGEVQLGRVNS